MEEQPTDISRREALKAIAGAGLLPFVHGETEDEVAENFDNQEIQKQNDQIIWMMYAVTFRLKSLENQMDEIMKPRKTPDNKGSI